MISAKFPMTNFLAGFLQDPLGNYFTSLLCSYWSQYYGTWLSSYSSTSTFLVLVWTNCIISQLKVQWVNFTLIDTSIADWFSIFLLHLGQHSPKISLAVMTRFGQPIIVEYKHLRSHVWFFTLCFFLLWKILCVVLGWQRHKRLKSSYVEEEVSSTHRGYVTWVIK